MNRGPQRARLWVAGPEGSAYQAYSVGQLRAAYAGALNAGAMWGRKGDEADMI